MKFSDFSESKFLAQKDLAPFPDGKVCTIKGYEVVEVSRSGEQKPAVNFKEFTKPMLLNKTNLKRLKAAFKTDDADETYGKKICVYIDETVMNQNGDIVGGLRLRPLSRDQATAVYSKEGPSDDVPF